jgi:peptidoglycan/LPS O-acetylase OafA/YrhL
LAVVLFHTFPKGLRGGFVGVDVFFVISGFLIAGIIDREIQAHRFSILDFYARRARRIFPALMVVLTFVLLIGAVVLLPAEYQQLGLHVAGGVGFIENLILWQEAGYFDGASEEKPLLHLWSLAVEEQFYLVFPWLLAGLHHWGRKVSGVLVMLIAVSFLAGLDALSSDASGAFFLPQNRVWELLVGAWIALSATPKRIIAHTSLKEGLSVLGLSLLIGSVILIRREMGFPGFAALPPVLGATLLIISGPETWVHRVILSSRFVVGLGLVSYPLYLWHWVLLSLGHILVPTLPAFGRLALVGWSLLLAFGTTRFIEHPIRFGSPPAVRVRTLGLWMGLIAVVGLGLYAADGIPKRFTDPRQQMVVQSPSSNRGADAACVGPLQSLRFCRTIGNERPKMALIGDSHSLHLVEGLKDAGLHFLFLGRAGCPPFLDAGLGGDQCPMGALNAAFEEVLQHPEIETVILAGRFGLYWHGQIPFEGRQSNQVDFPLLGSFAGNNPTVFIKQAEATVKALVAQGKRVVWILDVPELGFDPHQCLRRPEGLSRPKERCGISEVSYENRRKEYVAALHAIARRYPGVDFWDPRSVLCQNGFCSALTATEILFQDDDHLTLQGSRALGAKLAEELRAPKTGGAQRQ